MIINNIGVFIIIVIIAIDACSSSADFLVAHLGSYVFWSTRKPKTLSHPCSCRCLSGPNISGFIHIWQRCTEMIQRRVGEYWHTLLTQLLLTFLLPHLIIVRDNRLEYANLIRWWRWTPAASVKLHIKECVMNRMISKSLPNVCVSQSLCCGIAASISGFELLCVDYFWQVLARLNDLVLF